MVNGSIGEGDFMMKKVFLIFFIALLIVGCKGKESPKLLA